MLVNGDLLVEPNETFVVNLSAPTNATLADGQGIGAILDDEPRMSINDATVTEGNTGAVNATFTVSLSVAYDVAVTVHFQTANGSAAAGSDYVAASGDVIIVAGQTTKTFTVAVLGHRSAEPTENFVVNLSAATNGLIADSEGVGTITDDEPRINISDVSAKEGKKNQATLFTFTVTLSAAYDQAVTMSFRTVDCTAKTGNSDYIAKTGTLTFAPGETTKTITIEVKGDRKKEANETFYLDLVYNSGNSVFTKNRGIGTILNDDQATPRAGTDSSMQRRRRNPSSPRPGHQCEMHGMDLFTVLEHEIGHMLGIEHQATGVMEDTLVVSHRYRAMARCMQICGFRA